MENATIKDIAREAGFSVATVSRVINGNYPVSTETRQRVLQAIEDLHYTPNAIARSLRKNRTDLVALIVEDISSVFLLDIAKGLEEELEKDGMNLILASSDGSPEKERRLIDLLMKRRCDGLVIATTDHDPSRIKSCMDRKMPVVLVDRTFQELRTNQIGWNNLDASVQLTQYLIDRGHQKIGMMNCSTTSINGSKRLEGFSKAMDTAHLDTFAPWVSPSLGSTDNAYHWVKALLTQPERPTALFCGNYRMLEGVLMAMEDLGLKLGEDLSVVSFGRKERSLYRTLPVTYMKQPSQEMGREAGRLLKRLIQFPEERITSHIILETELVEAGSVKDLRTSPAPGKE